MKNNSLVFLDTNVFIYFFEAKGELGLKAKKIFESLAKNKIHAVTSVITQLELLSVKSSEENARHLLELFLETPNLTIVNLDAEIAIEAARIRRAYGYRTPDAVQLATAVSCKVKKFVTNDKRLLGFKELEVKLL